MALADDKGMFAGSVPAGPGLAGQRRAGRPHGGRRVIVSMPLDDELLLGWRRQSPLPDGVDLALACAAT